MDADPGPPSDWWNQGCTYTRPLMPGGITGEARAHPGALQTFHILDVK